jgi:apolipoprotein N-acyltransferase
VPAPFVYLAGILSGVAISVAWWLAETVASAVLGWLAALLLVFAVRARRAYLPAYCCGLGCCSLGFYWMYSTIAVFGGQGAMVAALLFTLYVAATAAQFLVFAFLHHQLGPRCDAFALRAPVALVLSELISIRLFPWHFGHTQIAFLPFAQLASVAGAMLISFMMFWLAEVAVRTLLFRERRRTFLIPVALVGLSLVYGLNVLRTFSPPPGTAQEVVLVQGNTAIPTDASSLERNIAKLHELTREAARAHALFVWPESAIPIFIPAALHSVREAPVLPWIGRGTAFLVGAHADQETRQRYNAAFAINADGSIPRPYLKRILIPFGEYMPLASWLPWLNKLNPQAAVFSAGTEATVFDFPMHRADGTPYTLKVAPLICYEDTVPALAREASQKGAELLANLTYDTWFGRSAAPHEHHLIAAFRAIENRRYLIRATNTGLTAVVDPLGRTTAQLPMFADGALSATVHLLNDQTIYTALVRERPWWMLLVATLAAIAYRHRKDPRARQCERPRLPGGPAPVRVFRPSAGRG